MSGCCSQANKPRSCVAAREGFSACDQADATFLDLATSEALKSEVRKKYGEVADLGQVSGAEQVATSFGYSKDELDSIPDGSNMGLSCGKPIDLASLKTGEFVLDLGSGGGIDCFLASAKVGPSGKVFGVDMTEEMIKLARKNAQARNITNVQFILGDIENLPLEDNFFDVVISNCVINLVPDKQKALNEIFRVLKPGGRIAITDIVTKRDLTPREKEGMALWVGCISGGMHIDRVQGMLKSAGFSGVDVLDSRADLNAYKLLGQFGGCCGSVEKKPVFSADPAVENMDVNDLAASVKIFATK